MNVHVELDTLASSNAVELSLESLSLDTVTGRWALVVLCAGRGASSASLLPVVGPVSVDVASHAAGGRRSLAVLAPHAVRRLRVGETVGVDNGEDIKVVLVLEGPVVCIGGSQKLVRGIFNNLE